MVDYIGTMFCSYLYHTMVETNDIIFNELVYGIIEVKSKNYFLSVIDELKLRGCDSVVLGCTEIPYLHALINCSAAASISSSVELI